jgi:peroxiredoxin
VNTATIASQVDEMHSNMAAQAPNEAMGAFRREQAELAASGVPEGVIGAGSQVLDADLVDVDGNAITLYAATGGEAAVVVFYRGAWCPYCNVTLSTYQSELLPKLAERGVKLIAVSPQTPDGSLSMQEKNELSFTVVSDPGNKLVTQLGILTAPSPEVLAAQLELGLDLTEVNADGATNLPMPTTLIIDRDHRLCWIDVHPDYTTRSEPNQILEALDKAGL